ncbi:MAG TPA: 50S ribosomal protein L15 [Desulfomicrobiaceae bacterium]|jgi:large subunit ribosomal protein L15|nr:50S ribosomal protein L15 [Desulfomicrobiaceae bacterium]
MNLHELYPFPEERKDRKRLGRGTATGQGSTSGKGHKGQNARAGGGVPVWFEGGQMPLQRRLPKRGFKNPFRVTYQPLNLAQLLSLFPEQDEITLEDLYAKGVANRNKPIKILGQGDIAKAVKVTAHKFSKQAAEKITQAGGQAIAVEG